ncbi:Asp-tRNA(Asn)/Glu-tRNA(Gln) amidotransferase subunit GatB, partial [Patescibacteria group bacterium]|nr:Asp-tRNA(Asn)/Glu-tRNA(Gln) amidotransferase subunit GatB [Patescibacteria group bacterium]
MPYKPAIGLEIHVELKTNSKMFCGCANDAAEKRPNFNICPICSGQPGTLPLANKKAIELTVKAALALNCKINKFSKFDRKNYFYPDLPKGYQISQYDEPFSKEGYLDIEISDEKNELVKLQSPNDKLQKISNIQYPISKRVRITRIHLEEDTGKLIHPDGADYSLVDLNRAGAPLMELVTEPDIASSGEAKQFCQNLQQIFRYLNISDADMEKGQMRCEVNISLSQKSPKDKPTGQAKVPEGPRTAILRGRQANGAGKSQKLGTKVEIKNLNSFKAVEKSIEHEIIRQRKALEAGGKITQETRGWDENKEITFSQRAKEEAHDYRYFPEPDLPPIDFEKSGAADIEAIRNQLPELPEAKRKRFAKEYKLPINDIGILVSDKKFSEYFEEAVSELDSWIKDKKLPQKGKEH